jgi:apolipoprotein N-acyltransferase
VDIALAIASGVLLALSFPKFGHPASAWISLAPLLLAVSGRFSLSARRAFLLGILTGAVYFAGTLYWLVETMTTFGGLSTPLAVIAAALLVAYLALFPGIFALVQWRLARAFGTAAVLLAPAVWVATEMGRTYIWDGFPWELLGYSQAGVLPIAQLASVVGVYGLSALVAGVSAVCAFAAVDAGRRRWVAAAAAAVVLLGSGVWGMARIRSSALTQQGTPIRVAVVQGNILQDDKWNPALAGPIMQRYIDMTREAIGRGARFIIWPESSTPFNYEEEPPRAEAVRRLAREAHVTLLIGSDQIEKIQPVPAGRPPAPHYYNAAFLIQPDGTTGAVYRKIHLVPFGEYVPLKRLLFFVGTIVEAVSDYSPGTETVLLPVAGHQASTAICYEVIYSSLMRAFVTRGSELLTTITNDAWYGRSSAAYQHWQQASLRAVEEGRYLARAANTGISGFVDPYGRVLQRSELFRTAVMTEDLRFIDARTIYSRIGDLVGWLSVALTAAALVAARRAR